jgi:uncharacterized protein (DUF433 family)
LICAFAPVMDIFTVLFAIAGAEPGAYHVDMLDWGDCQQVERSEGKLSGAWVFRGTRVPVRALFENLEAGASVNDFLEWFPGVTLEQAVAVLAHAEHSLVEV